MLQCAHLISSLLFPPPPPPHHPRYFFSSSVGVILSSAPLTSSLDCIWPSGKRRQSRTSSFSHKKRLHFSLIDESPIGCFRHLSPQLHPPAQEHAHPGWKTLAVDTFCFTLKVDAHDIELRYFQWRVFAGGERWLSAPSAARRTSNVSLFRLSLWKSRWRNTLPLLSLHCTVWKTWPLQRQWRHDAESNCAAGISGHVSDQASNFKLAGLAPVLCKNRQ